MPKEGRGNRGFSLIEIAVVLVIGTLVIGALVQYITVQLIAARQTATRTKQDSIKTALINFIARNNRLPCPAIATIPAGGVGNGVEATPGTCVGAVVSGSVVTGTIPWVSLGLPSETSLDGYSNRYTYQVVLSATNLTAQTVSGMRGGITIHSAGPGALGSSSATNAGNQLNDCRTDLTVPYIPSANPCSAVVVVVSHGADGYGAFNDAGNQITFPPSVVGLDEAENANADSMFVVRQYSDIPSNPYDDIVLALTPGDLLALLTGSGGMQDYRAAINSKFNIIKSAVVGNAVQLRVSDATCVAGSCAPTFGTCAVTTPCGIPFFRYTLATADAAPNTIPAVLSLPVPIKNDPWGNPIQYVVTTPAITPTTSPVAVAFTLTSPGPDGVAANIDDISTTIYVGELLAQFSKY